MARRRARAGGMRAAALLACSLRLAAAHVYRDFDTQNVQGLAKSHPLQTAPGTVGLPNGCNTYAERYGRYANFSALKGGEWDPNAEHPDSDEVVLVRFHVGGRLPWDLQLHLRALMAEAAAVGKHVYLLHEDRPQQQTAGGAAPHELRAGIPPELRPIAHAYSPEALAAQYPGASTAQQTHLPFVAFLHAFPAYRFAWCLEHDVRYTGSSWGDFLNAALHHASLAVQTGSNSSSSGGSGRRRLASTVLQRWASGEEGKDAGDRDETFKELFIVTKGRGKAGGGPGNSLGSPLGRKAADDSKAPSGKGGQGEADEAETLESFSAEQRSRPPGLGPSRVALRRAEGERAHQVWRAWQPYRPEHHEALRREAAAGGLTLDQLAALERKGRAVNASDSRHGGGHGGGHGLPDLLLFGSALEDLGDEEMGERERWGLSNLHRADLHAMGLSRRMAAALHAAAAKGVGGAAEEVVPSLAMEQGLDVVSLPVSSWGGDSHSCCSEAAKIFYKGWKLSKQCRHHALLHPVRVGRADAGLSEGP